MSLRSQIQAAVDEVAPPAPDLERKVKAFVLADTSERKALRRRPRTSPWAYRFQGAAGLVAAAVVVALIAGVVLGGRIWRDMNSTPSTINPTQLKGLEARHLNFTTVARGAACPTTALTLNPDLGMVVGGGPVYVGNRDVFESGSWGFWVAVGFASSGQTPGLVLLRAKDLQSDSQVAFAHYPLAPTAITAVGRALGSDELSDGSTKVQLRSEAVFQDPPGPWHPGQAGGAPAELVVLLGMQSGSSGCIGLQIDGPDFTENLVFQPAMRAF